MASRKRRAFTLSELLVLVILVTTNAGLLALGLEKVHAAAVRARCTSGIGQPSSSQVGANRLG